MMRWSRQLAHGCVPVAPRVEPQRLDEGGELGAPLGERRRDVGERLLLAGLHLDLGRDQLADEVRLERRALRGGLHLLEAVHEVERRGVEERELLLDRDGEVLGGVEALARLGRGSVRVARRRLMVREG